MADGWKQALMVMRLWLGDKRPKTSDNKLCCMASKRSGHGKDHANLVRQRNNSWRVCYYFTPK